MQILIFAYLLLGLFHTMSCGAYYIIPSELEKDNCSIAPCNCLTLSQFADDSTRYNDSNITLFVAGGNYTLVDGLTVANVSKLSIFLRNTDAIISCRDSASFSFTNIYKITISGVKFRGCGGNRIQAVQEMTLEHSSFLGGPRANILDDH